MVHGIASVRGRVKTASVKLRRKVMASLSRLLMRGSAKDLKASWHLAEAKHASTSGLRDGQAEMDGLGLKTSKRADFVVWASKSWMHLVWLDGGDRGHVASSRNLRQDDMSV